MNIARFPDTPGYANRASTLVVALLVAAAVLVGTTGTSAPVVFSSATAGDATSAQAVPQGSEALAHVSPSFVANQGQTSKEVSFLLTGADSSHFFTDHGVRSRLQGDERAWVIEQRFLHTSAAPVGVHAQASRYSWFKGAPADWVADAPSYAAVRYEDVWPGIDAVFAGRGADLEYRFIVRPSAAPADVQLAYQGARLSIAADGALQVATPVRSFVDEAPVAYQGRGVERQVVPSGWRVDGHRYGFRIGAYDHRRPLIIDPTSLVYAGYLGGSANDLGMSVAVGPSGSLYVTGDLASTAATFPVAVGPDLVYNGGTSDAFVAKVNPAGTGFDYVGYIGGNGIDHGRGIAVSTTGAAYIVGSTTSTAGTFPVVVGPDLTSNTGEDAFVAKVDPSGTSLVYAGYIGGTGTDVGHGIDVVGNEAYITGDTNSTQASFPETVGPDLTYQGGISDAFVAKVNATGSALSYAGYIGGSAEDNARGIAVAPSGNAVVAGYTTSTQTTFPVLGGPDLTQNGSTDAFVTSVGVGGTGLTYSGFIGGSVFEDGADVAVDAAGAAYVVGQTTSTADFPAQVGPDLVHNGLADAYIAKVDTGGNSVFAGYIGGSANDYGRGIAVDAFGNAYVTGNTNSTEATFPVVGGPDLTQNGGTDVFVTKINATGTNYNYSGFVGGSGTDFSPLGIAVDGKGDAYLSGYTNSTEATFPVVGGPDPSFNGGSNDAFVAKVSVGLGTTIDSGPSGTVISTGATFAFSGAGGTTFDCRSDLGSWAPCTSPVVLSGLSAGPHSFDVRGKDGFGNMDLLPVTRTWTVAGCPSSFTYIGADGGDWMTPSNWNLASGSDGNGIPDTNASCALVPGLRVVLNTNITVGGVTLTSANGAIAGSGTLSVDGLFQWSNGKMLGQGTTRILPNGQLNIDGNPVRLGGCVPASPCTQKRTLDLQGTTTLSGPGAILADDGTHIINTGTFLIGNDGGVVPGLADTDPAATFVNNGVIRKTGETTPGVPSVIAATFSGTGTVEVLVGNLQIWTTGPIEGPVDPGQTISTGTTADTLLPGGGIEHRDFATSVENQATGEVTFAVDETTTAVADKGGYGFLPFRTVVEADSAAGIDAEVTVEADSTQLAGSPGTQVWAFDHGTLVPECPDLVTVAPDPCVTREITPEGDARLVVHTERLGTPDIGPLGPTLLMPTPLGHARKEPVSADVVVSELEPITFNVTAAGITPSSATTVLGSNAAFEIDPGHGATVGDGLGDAGMPLASLTDVMIDPTALMPAGSYTVAEGLQQATLGVKPQFVSLQPSDGHDLHVTMSALAPTEYCATCVFDVQYRLKAQGKKKWGAWKVWGENEDVAAATYTATAKGHGTYQVRVRLENTGNGATSGWSPTSASVKVNK